MSRKFEVEWPDFGVTIIAELFDDENPELCDRFWQVLPFETVPMPSMSPGELFIIPVPVTLPSREERKLVLLPDEPPGPMVSFSGLGILFKYGIVVEPFNVPRIANVPEAELEKFRSIVPQLIEAYFFTKKVSKAIFRKKE
jgi:hypothetical protein